MSNEAPDILVIGAGPGGYPAAIRAAQLGLKVVVVDKGTVGGECLNWGCIPSKALISAANYYYKVSSEIQKMGIHVKEVNINFKETQEWKNGIIKQLVDGIKQLFKLNKIKLIIGNAELIDKKTVKIQTEEGEKIFTPKNIIIATGAGFISLPEFQIDEEKILSAKGILSLTKIPDRLLIIGAGVIGVELGTVFAKLGTKVIFVELMPEILPGIDPGVSRLIKRKLKRLGVEIYTESIAKKWEDKGDHLEITVESKKKGIFVLTADKILLSVGKRATTKDLSLENAGVITDEKGFIKVNEKMQTNVPGIYAVGDCTGLPFLAHKATKQGIIAAEVIAGLESKYDYKAIPSAIFTDPEVGVIGISEKQAKEEGREIIIGKVPLGISGKALSELETLGYVKVIADKSSDEILGIEIVGPHASDIVSEASLAIENGISVEKLGHTIHPHPTIGELLMEAAEAALKKAIHVSR